MPLLDDDYATEETVERQDQENEKHTLFKLHTIIY